MSFRIYPDKKIVIKTHKEKEVRIQTHTMGPEIYGLVPNVALVLNGNWISRINPGDEVVTPLVHYRVDSLGYDAEIDKTTCLVREIVP
jgi:hypothetical protein